MPAGPFCPVASVTKQRPVGPQVPEHVAQVAAPVPQDAFVWLVYASHVPLVPPLQQPVGHVLASQEQVPLVVSQTPFEHIEHVAPPLPHPALVCDEYDTHLLLASQQPPGHDTVLQMQCPVILSHS